MRFQYAPCAIVPSRALPDRCGRPDLAMGMRIAGAHHGAAIFEDLHVVNESMATKLAELS